MKCDDKEWQHCQVEKMGCHGCYYNEIEIGEYVRTENGFIGKIVNENIDAYLLDKRIRPYGNSTRDYCIFKDEINSYGIVKHSKKITDLIEVGDVLKIKEDNSICYIGLEKDETTLTYKEIIDEIKNNKIKLLAIVTKEKFKSVEYEVSKC